LGGRGRKIMSEAHWVKVGDPIRKITKAKRTVDMVKVVECLPRNLETLRKKEWLTFNTSL
jgi:hypothetical protein